MRARVWLLGVVLAGLLAAPPAAAASYVRIELTGTINPVRARYVQRALEQARAERAAFVLVTIDTPGGLVESMEGIAGSFVNSPVPVIGYVEPRGAQATSAGALILLATDVAAMAPGTRVGAAHPVGAGKDLEGAVNEKATNSMVALAKSLAERRGRSLEVAEQIVRQSSSFTAAEAQGRGGIEIIADDRAALLSALDGRNVELGKRTLTLRTRGIRERTIGLSFAERILDVAADPTLASLLISIGVLGILYELASPGLGVGGIVGAIALLGGLLGVSVLSMQATAVLLLIAGVLAIGAEVKVGAHGLVGFGGLVAIVIAGLVLVDESRYFGAVPTFDWAVFVPIFAVFASGFVVIGRALARSLNRGFETGREALIGKSGVAKTDFHAEHGAYRGHVFVDGARWQAESKEPVADGEAITVVGLLEAPRRLEVRSSGRH